MLQAGSSWTTLPTTLPPHVGDASVNTSFAYENNSLVIMGAKTTTRESGAVLSVHNGIYKHQSNIPGLGSGGRYTWQSSGQTLSTAATPVLVQGRYLYAIVANPSTRKNCHGYTPAEEIYRADLKDYLSKGFLENALDFLGGLYCAVGGGSPPPPFWRPVAEMEHCGASLEAVRTSETESLLIAVGGFQTLSPKFYQVFSAKEKVSRAARRIKVNAEDGTYSDWAPLPDMIMRRKNLCTVVVGGYVYAIGGQDGKGKSLASVERLNLSLRDAVWEPVSNLKDARHQFAATVTSSGIIVVAGGCNDSNGRLGSVECLVHTVENDQVWKPLPNLQTPRMGASLSIVNNKLIVAGGTKTPGPFWGTGTLDTMETLDIVTSVVENPPASTVSSTFNNPPIAHAEVIFDEEEDTQGFVPVIHAPPMAPAYWHQPQFEASIAASAPYMESPSAPAADNEAHAQSSASLPTPIPPPQDKTAAALASVDASPLPPPMRPPAQATTQPIERSQDDLSCAVCLERKKQVAFFCGHQVCLHCSPQLQECHICRKPIEGRIQLFGD